MVYHVINYIPHTEWTMLVTLVKDETIATSNRKVAKLLTFGSLMPFILKSGPSEQTLPSRDGQ